MNDASSECGKRFGADFLIVNVDGISILAANPMDWQVREFCRVPVFVEGRKYVLRSKSKTEPPVAMRYDLETWPENLAEESSEEIHYTRHYIAERDCEFARARRGAVANFLLLPFFPMLGLFWSGLKRGPLRAAGFEASTITKASVIFMFHLWAVEGVFIGWLRGGLLMFVFSSGKIQWLDFLFWILISVDTVVRAGGAMKLGTGYHTGFYEWLIPGRNNAEGE